MTDTTLTVSAVFDAAINDLIDAATAHASDKADVKATNDKRRAAENRAAWCMVDCLSEAVAAHKADETLPMPTADDASDYGLRIADAQGIEKEARRKYAQRARAVLTYLPEIVAIGTPVTDADTGVATDPRSKASPLSKAQGFLTRAAKRDAEAQAQAQAQAKRITLRADAYTLAAKAMDVSEDALAVLIEDGDADAKEALAAGYADAASNATLAYDYEAMTLRIAAMPRDEAIALLETAYLTCASLLAERDDEERAAVEEASKAA